MNLLFKNMNSERVGDTSFIEHYAGVNSSMSLSKLKPSIRQATQLKILKFIKPQYYNEIWQRFDTDTLTDSELEILPSLQDAIAHYAIVQKLDEGGANLSELGLHYRNDDGSSQQVPQWQFFAAKYDLTKKADAFLENFISYVFENKEGFENFNTSFDLFFIESPKQLSNYLPVENSTMLFFALASSFKMVSERIIKPLFTKAFYDDFLNEVRTGADLSDVKTELLEKIRVFIAPSALLNSINFLTVDLSDGKLFAVSTNDGYRNRSAIRAEQIDTLIQSLLSNCESAMEELETFINENIEGLGLENEIIPYEKIVVSTNSVGLF